MNHTWIIDAFGRMFINPDKDSIKTHLNALFSKDTQDCLLRDVSMSHYHSGYALIFHDNHILTLENINQKEEPIRFISDVALDKAYDLFLALKENQIDTVTSLPWEKQ